MWRVGSMVTILRRQMPIYWPTVHIYFLSELATIQFWTPTSRNSLCPLLCGTKHVPESHQLLTCWTQPCIHPHGLGIEQLSFFSYKSPCPPSCGYLEPAKSCFLFRAASGKIPTAGLEHWQRLMGTISHSLQPGFDLLGTRKFSFCPLSCYPRGWKPRTARPADATSLSSGWTGKGKQPKQYALGSSFPLTSQLACCWNQDQ